MRVPPISMGPARLTFQHDRRLRKGNARVNPTAIQLIGAALFALAILHTFGELRAAVEPRTCGTPIDGAVRIPPSGASKCVQRRWE
jgi:hypothetical protein